MTEFNSNLNNWNVSKVKNMIYMFAYCTYFNQPLNKWDVSNVENMAGMFLGAKKFNQPLNNWNVSKVKDMSDMFHNCEDLWTNGMFLMLKICLICLMWL